VTPLARCGTRAAYMRHRRRGEQPCGPCRAANAAYLTGRRAAAREAKPARTPWQAGLAPCGTPAAYRRHHRHGEKPCQACIRAESEARGYTQPGLYAVAPAAARNGLPVVPYAWRARTYPWAQRTLADAIARYGAPEEEAS
jgi:hypothetical protein